MMTERGGRGKTLVEWRGDEREKRGDKGMLALRGGTCCRRRGGGDVGGRRAVGGTGKRGVRWGRGRGWH